MGCPSNLLLQCATAQLFLGLDLFLSFFLLITSLSFLTPIFYPRLSCVRELNILHLRSFEKLLVVVQLYYIISSCLFSDQILEIGYVPGSELDNKIVGEVCFSVARNVTNDQWLTIKKSMDQKVPLKIKRGYLSVCPPKKRTLSNKSRILKNDIEIFCSLI